MSSNLVFLIILKQLLANFDLNPALLNENINFPLKACLNQLHENLLKISF